jgi:ABC-type sugar transport system permease subunit
MPTRSTRRCSRAESWGRHAAHPARPDAARRPGCRCPGRPAARGSLGAGRGALADRRLPAADHPVHAAPALAASAAGHLDEPALLAEPTWRGLANYRDFLAADYFWTSIEATLIYSLSTAFQLILALVAALALKQTFVPWKPLLRGIMIIAYAMPPVVVGAIWLFLLDPNLGMVTNYLLELGIIDYPIYWFAENTWAKWTITLVASWTFWPFMFLIILSSLQGIPQSHYELAEVYGANLWQRFTTVTWPNIQGAILVVVILRLAFNLAKIDQPFQLTGGGPGYETSVLSILMYRFAFMSGDFGMAFTVGMFLVAITALLLAPFAIMYQRHLRHAGR